MPDLKKFSHRMQVLIKEFGDGRKTTFAEFVGISDVAIGKYSRGLRYPDAKTLRDISSKCSVSPTWLLFGIGPKYLQDLKAGKMTNESVDNLETIDVPYYDIQASAGHGLTADGAYLPKTYSIPLIFFENILKISSDHVLILQAEGDSMEPTIHAGAHLIISQKDDNKKLEGIFVLSMDGSLYVKRLLKTQNGIRIISDNPLYSSTDVDKKFLRWGVPETPDEVGIIGRVVHILQRAE